MTSVAWNGVMLCYFGRPIQLVIYRDGTGYVLVKDHNRIERATLAEILELAFTLDDRLARILHGQ